MAHSGGAFSCVKRRSARYETGEIRATGRYSRFFGMRNSKFAAVSCTECGCAGIFRGGSSELGDFLDILAGR